MKQPNDSAFRLWFWGLNAQLATELRHLYENSLSEPLPEKVRELLMRLSTPEAE